MWQKYGYFVINFWIDWWLFRWAPDTLKVADLGIHASTSNLANKYYRSYFWDLSQLPFNISWLHPECVGEEKEEFLNDPKLHI